MADELLHSEYHWKDNVKYLLQYFKTKQGVKSRMTVATPTPSKKDDV